MIIILTCLVLILTLLPLLSYDIWWVRGCDFPRLQFLFLAFVVFILQLFFLDLANLSSWILIAIIFYCIIHQAWWIYPYTKLARLEVQSSDDDAKAEDRLSIITANVLTTNKNAQALLDIITKEQPDIVVTLESDSWWQQQLCVLEKDYSYTVKCPLDNLYGIHLYSKLELFEEEIMFLIEDDVPSIHAIVSLRNGKKIKAYFIHPAPPSPTENKTSTERDVELLLVAKSVSGLDMPVIVTGDLNDVAWSKTTRLFRKISGLLDPRVGRGIFNTFHAKYWFLRWPLDHIFHSEHFALDSIKRLDKFGSDHFAILTKLSLMPEKESQNHQTIEKDDEDVKEANEKINKKT